MNRQKFISTFSQLEKDIFSVKHFDEQYDSIRKEFLIGLSKGIKSSLEKHSSKSLIHEHMEKIEGTLKDINTKWEKVVANREKGIDFRKRHNDSLLVFINGKVKSGKSSLGNYVAWGSTNPDQDIKKCAPINFKPTYFSHEKSNVTDGDDDKEAEKKCAFRVGATEATSSIQGFNLPGLTWVDSPGLHSCNAENGLLAKEYLDHADLVLYTMSSDAPGRESDIDEINELISKSKRFILLITGSDYYEEDEVDGRIIKKLCIKNKERQLDQVNYVKAALSKRYTNKIEVISISSHYAQINENNDEEYEKSGMSEMFHQLSTISKSEGVKLKRNTPLKNLLNFINFSNKQIDDIKNLIENVKKPLSQQKESNFKLLQTYKQEARIALSAFVDDQFTFIESIRENPNKVKSEIEKIKNNLSSKTISILTEYTEKIRQDAASGISLSLENSLVESNLYKMPEYSIKESVEQVQSFTSGTKKRNRAIGAGLGGVLGGLASIPFGGVGALAGASLGATIGSLFGGLSGDDSGTKTINVNVYAGDNLIEIKKNIKDQCNAHIENHLSKHFNVLWNDLEENINYLFVILTKEIDQYNKNTSNLNNSINAKINS